MALAAGFTTSCVNDDDYAVPTLECVDSTLQKTKGCCCPWVVSAQYEPP